MMRGQLTLCVADRAGWQAVKLACMLAGWLAG